MQKNFWYTSDEMKLVREDSFQCIFQLILSSKREYRILFWRQQREDILKWSVVYSGFLCDSCSSDYYNVVENFSETA